MNRLRESLSAYGAGLSRPLSRAPTCVARMRAEPPLRPPDLRTLASGRLHFEPQLPEHVGSAALSALEVA